VNAIQGEVKYIHIIDQETCVKCGQCLEVCPPKVAAVNKVATVDMKNLEQLPEIIPCAERRKKIED
jgi:Fe-S-cluster-containing hydrogenase component 2